MILDSKRRTDSEKSLKDLAHAVSGCKYRDIGTRTWHPHRSMRPCSQRNSTAQSSVHPPPFKPPSTWLGRFQRCDAGPNDFPIPRLGCTAGPAITTKGSWSAPVQLTSKPRRGYRPQVAVGKDGTIHALYYERTDDGDLDWHRRSSDGVRWSDPLHLGHNDNRNWDLDLVASDDGSVMVVYDHALPDFRSRGFITQFNGESWSTPAPISPDNGGEVGSGHAAHGEADTLAYVFIGKQLDLSIASRPSTAGSEDGAWDDIGQFTDGEQDAWHTNVERRPDGSMLAGWDVGQGGAETQLMWSMAATDAGVKPGEHLSEFILKPESASTSPLDPIASITSPGSTRSPADRCTSTRAPDGRVRGPHR